MAKFVVGEKCLAWRQSTATWHECTVTALPGKWRPTPDAYEIEVPGVNSGTKYGEIWLSYEADMRKLPGDSAEDPGVTRIKKLLEQDFQKHKETA